MGNFAQNLAENWSNWYIKGSLFLEKLVFVWVYFQILWRHIPTTPPPPPREKALQEDLDTMVQWSQSWGMQFNPSKCKTMRVSRKRSPGTTCMSYNILGVTLDRDCHISALFMLKKGAQLVFSCFWLQIWRMLKFGGKKKKKKKSILWYTKFQLVHCNSQISWSRSTFFCKMSRHVKNLAQMQGLCTQIANTSHSFGYRSCITDRAHFMTQVKWLYCNFLIPNPSQLVDPSF